ncbi:phosphoenolpyruvate synthase [Ralstonia syzygii subsp. celebesensis]|uniref:Phosphoenolpyruvate synthase n=6 Tax=Ralstonia solanacearum species complex TaxID=3116862 RepID=A0A1U9VDF9_9RALS|nr:MULTISPECIES: phosphoenolpyruvate synthase [Ralstonia solanacearum species complex]CCA82265.1 phosphoenolpyruvate synthase. Pyruvate,water dikinase [blood disease bacterium R229]BEU72252.1 phosphoenolpyruvate synthase [Ralstonia pseudosolanacearum]AQW28689.1 phosphoenolpyruvate synthase [blood disease bacterium A2-HR MARDI]AXV77131.1 phosphoenolpyruvate synthase [Ralstonia solanacearum]AXV91148.1 phosphoenolpyruvate synthase [Ralstonia solanacearum]
MTNQSMDGAYVLPFEQLRMTDVEVVGGKNASLGEMISQLDGAGVRVPGGFATTALAFRDFLAHNDLTERISQRLASLDVDDVKALAVAGKEIREWVATAPFQPRLEQEIRAHFERVSKREGAEASFAVRSSATAEDLPDASFAGQQESYLNVSGIDDVLDKIKHVFASLYNDRAISYRVHKGFAHDVVALSAGIQRMVRSDCGASGVMFTIDTESGFQDVVFITSSYGLGETVVQGAVNPDEFYVFKPTLAAGKYPIIRRSIGSKLIKMEFTQAGEEGRVKTVDVPGELRNRYSLVDEDVVELAKYAVIIEKHYGRPMDIEWGKDGKDGKIYILQARPETVKSQSVGKVEQRFRLKGSAPVLTTGRAIGQKIGTGPVRVINDPAEMERVQPGDVLVADMTDPNWEPVMKRASAIVTNRGGRTCHAAIIARELGVPAVVGCGDATDLLTDGTLVTVSCAEGDEGKIYDGLLETEVTEVRRGEMPPIDVKIMMNVGNPQLAFEFAQIPNGGVGLARLEFIINNNIGVHPKAILDYPQVDSDLKKAVESVARGHASPRAFYVDKLAEGIATIAAAFYPKPVIVRLSDFKSNEYKKLIGGSRYEPDEENPMLGFRGASRYIAEDFAEAFEMECRAMKRVREEMGLTNVEIMVPFVRTLGQAAMVVDLLGKYGLKRGENDLRLIMMCEVPSNAILAKEFLEYFDGFSIGSNDLTQLTLGLDRDSGMELLAKDFDERDPAVKFMLSRAISTAKSMGKYVGICGQGPSDHPDFAVWLAKEGISSISLNPDSVIDTWQTLGSA